jgi:hypothetical protein
LDGRDIARNRCIAANSLQHRRGMDRIDSQVNGTAFDRGRVGRL